MGDAGGGERFWGFALCTGEISGSTCNLGVTCSIGAAAGVFPGP